LPCFLRNRFQLVTHYIFWSYQLDWCDILMWPSINSPCFATSM
jgi:hypothetical protein